MGLVESFVYTVPFQTEGAKEFSDTEEVEGSGTSGGRIKGREERAVSIRSAGKSGVS